MDNHPLPDQPPGLSPVVTSSTPVILVLLVVDSMHFVFARLVHPYLPGGTGAMYVLGIATLQIAIFLQMGGRIRFQVFREHAIFFLSVGFLVATATTINYVAVGYVDPGTASMVAQTSTLFALALSLIWLRERLSGWQIVGTAVALAGIFIISFQPGDVLRVGSLMVLSSAFMYALHAAVVKRYGGELDFANFFLFRVAATSAFLLLFTTARGQLVLPTEGIAWFYLALAGTVDVVISRVLYYLALRRLQMSFHTLILTLSPVITILWSMALFGERPTVQAFMGGVAVIAGVLIVSWSRARRPVIPLELV